MQTKPVTRTLAFLLANLIAGRPVDAQQQVNLSIAQPTTVPTYTQIVPTVTTTQVISPGSVNLSNVSVKPVPQESPITLGSFGGTNGNCTTAIPSQNLMQDCILGNSPFESNMINLWLAVHGLPASEAPAIYQYGGIDLRSDIRSFMWAYIAGVIQEDPSLRNANDKAVYNWIQNAVQANESEYYQKATDEYHKWEQSPCTYALNPIVAAAYGLSYDGAGYCGASIQNTLSPLPAPDVSYFKEVGQLLAYDSKISLYDPLSPTSANVTGAKVMLAAEQNIGKWESLGGLGVSIAAGTAAGAVVIGNIGSITPFSYRDYVDADNPAEAEATEATEQGIEESAEAVAEETEDIVEAGAAAGDVLGAITIVLIFVEIAAQASINLAQDLQNENAINAMINYGETTALQPPDLNAMLQDADGYQKVFETFMAATLPDAISFGPAPTLPGAPSVTDPSTDVFYLTSSSNSPQVRNSFNYTTWDPQFPTGGGNAPYTQYGTLINAFPFQLGFVQTVLAGSLFKTFFSPTLKYIDPTTGIRYIADLIDKGRFLVNKDPDDIQPGDYDCPADPVLGVTQTPTTEVPSVCRSFIMSSLNFWGSFSGQTLQIPQAPVFSTPNAADFSTAGDRTFSPLLDMTTQTLPCSIRATGTLPPGFAFQNDTLFLQVPSLAVPGAYQFNLVADCETLGLGTPLANYTFGTAMTTQSFTANVYLAPGAIPIAMDANLRPAAIHPETSANTPLQFVFPTSGTSLTFTQGRSTQLQVNTNGGAGTTITAEANSLPPGMTLTDNGNGTATVNGIPTGQPGSCSSNCAITASLAGYSSASLILNYTVASPVLPTISSTQSDTWNAAESNIATIDGSASTNNTPTNVALSWSVVGSLPNWATFTDNGNNIATIKGIPPVSLVGQTIPIQFQYSYGGTFTSPTFTMNVTVNPPAAVLRVSPSLLYQVGVFGSGSINSSTLSGGTGLSGTWQVNATLPQGLTATPNGTSLEISGTPLYAGNSLIPIQFTPSAGTAVTRNIAMMITQPASLSNFPSRLVLFEGVRANVLLPVSAGFPRDAAGSPGNGLPSTSGTNLALNGTYSTTNGYTVFSNGGTLYLEGTPVSGEMDSLTASAQTNLSTGPVGAVVSQPFTLYVQPAGDVNLDGVVNCADYDLILAHYGAVIGQPKYLDLADPNRDGVVNILDLAFVQSHLPKGTVCH